MNTLITENLFEKLKKLFSPGLWLVILTCTLYIDLYRIVFPQFSFENYNFKNLLAFIILTGFIMTILPFMRFVVYALMVSIDHLCGYRLSKQFYTYSGFDERFRSRDGNVHKKSLLKYAIAQDNEVALRIVDDFEKRQDDAVQLAKIRTNLFILLSIEAFTTGSFYSQFQSSQIEFIKNTALLMTYVFPVLVLYFNFKSYFSDSEDYIELTPEIKSLVQQNPTDLK